MDIPRLQAQRTGIPRLLHVDGLSTSFTNHWNKPIDQGLVCLPKHSTVPASVQLNTINKVVVTSACSPRGPVEKGSKVVRNPSDLFQTRLL